MPKPFLSVTYRSTSYPRPIENTDLLCHYLTNTVSQLPKDAEVFCLGDFKIDSLYFVLAAYCIRKKNISKKVKTFKLDLQIECCALLKTNLFKNRFGSDVVAVCLFNYSISQQYFLQNCFPINFFSKI